MWGWPQTNSDLSLTSPPDSGAQSIPAHLSLLSLIRFLFVLLCRTPPLPAWDLTDTPSSEPPFHTLIGKETCFASVEFLNKSLRC